MSAAFSNKLWRGGLSSLNIGVAGVVVRAGYVCQPRAGGDGVLCAVGPSSMARQAAFSPAGARLVWQMVRWNSTQKFRRESSKEST